MLEKFQTLLDKLKKEQKERTQEMDLKFVQNLFEMQDINKWLKFNAMNEKQLQNVQNFENHIQELLKKLCVPNYQSENA